MSMNINFVAKRTIYVPAIKYYDTQEESISSNEIIQTKTSETDEIINSDDPVEKYKEIILERYQNDSMLKEDYKRLIRNNHDWCLDNFGYGC